MVSLPTKKNGNGFVQNHLFLKESQDLEMEKIHIIKHKTHWNSYKIFKKKKRRRQDSSIMFN